MKMRRLSLEYSCPLVLCILFLAACGTLEVGIEHTPTSDYIATATVSALPTQAATLAAPTPMPMPSLGKLAYVQGGDIWVKLLPDGEPQRLTTDGRNREPRWSPSGQWLAFRQGENQVWVMRADGSGARPLNEGATVNAFAWSPAEDRLAYTTGVGALVVVNADGSSRRELVAQGSGGPYTGVVGMAWSPDGEWLAYERVDVLQKERPFERYAGLWRIRADGSGATELLNAGAPADYEPILADWSPDGSRILFWEDPQFSRSLLADGAPLLVLPAEGGQPVELADSVLAYPDFVVPGPADADRLAVIVGGNRSVWTNKVLHVLSATTGEDVALTPPGTSASSPAWSPDGQRLAYVAMPDRGDPAYGLDAEPSQMPRRLFVVSTRDTLHPQQLTDDPAYRDERPLWSSDGKWLLFVRVDAWGRASLWLIPAGGGTPCRVVEGLTQEPGVLKKYYGDWRRTIIPYYGHMDWDTLFDWRRGPATQRVQPKATVVAPIPTSTLGLTRTYTETEIGYALDYPADWHIQAEPGWAVILTSFELAPSGRGGVSPDQTKIDLLPDKSHESRALEELVAEVKGGTEPVQVLWEEQWKLDGGVPAVRMQIVGQGEMALLLTVINGRSLRMVGYGDLTLFDAIARTLRPLHQTLSTPVGHPTPAVAPGTTVDIDCADVVPFAPGCLDQPRPPDLASDTAFVGIIPAGPVRVAAWSPDGTHLAYAVVNPETGAFQGLEVRSLPDFRLEGRWAVPGIFDLTWTPDDQAVLFVFDRGDISSIGLARLGEPDWRDLLPGEKAVLAVSLGKNFVDWLGENVLAFQVGCGTGCGVLYALDIITSALNPLVTPYREVVPPDLPAAPYTVLATVYLFSPDHYWLAATDWGTGLPRAKVLEWPGPAEPLDLSARLDTCYTETQSWADSSVVFVAYPPGDPDTWVLPPRPDLYVWEADTGAIRYVASGAFRAVFAPTGDYLAVLFVGEPRVNEEGRIESEGSIPHLGLLRWPEGELLAAHLVSTKSISDVSDLWRLPAPIWSPPGKAVAFQPAGGGLALMNRDGHVWPMLTGKSVDWVGWGAGGNLALLVGEQIWLVQGLVRVPDVGPRPYTDAVLGMALDIPAEWEVHGFQGAEAHVVALDTTGTPQGVLTFSVVGAFDTLNSTLAEVRQGAWGPYIHDVQPVHLGEFEALRLELTPGEDRPPVVWLVVTPSGLAVGFIPESALALVESVLATLRAVPVREPWEVITPTPSTPNDLEGAREALTTFFSLLHARRYSEATNYYGGTYDVLRDWNPTVARDDHATLFQNGCTMNGLRCLRIRTIVREEQVSPAEFRFIVEFMNDDGTLFVRGPCCGATETEMPPQSQFPFTVKKVNNGFLVQDLPVYVP